MTDLPPPIGDASAWYGPDVAARVDWIEHLSSAELSEIESASRHLGQAEIDWLTLRSDDFALPVLSRRLSKIIHEVLEGRGFVLLRGLPVARWGRACRPSHSWDWVCIGEAFARKTDMDTCSGTSKTWGSQAGIPTSASTRPMNDRITIPIPAMWSDSCACIRPGPEGFPAW